MRSSSGIEILPLSKYFLFGQMRNNVPVSLRGEAPVAFVVPRAGMTTIYDRSWYGRVLVERLEGFARDQEWRRAFSEINEFERELVEHGVIVIKYWLHISKEEQLRRFRSREETEYKQHKINAEDWRNRRKWSAYETAVGDMLALTQTRFAPWHLIPANNKRFARLEIIKSSYKQIEAALAK